MASLAVGLRQHLCVLFSAVGGLLQGCRMLVSRGLSQRGLGGTTGGVKDDIMWFAKWVLIGQATNNVYGISNGQVLTLTALNKLQSCFLEARREGWPQALR